MCVLALLPIPDNIYNWIKDFFEEHYHCTRYAKECSLSTKVKASVIQGSGLGPASYIVTTVIVIVIIVIVIVIIVVITFIIIIIIIIILRFMFVCW